MAVDVQAIGVAKSQIIILYMFVVVNYDALAQASEFEIERSQVVFLCWMQDLNQGPWNRISSRLNARWQTDWAIEDQAKIWTQQPVPMISEFRHHFANQYCLFLDWLNHRRKIIHFSTEDQINHWVTSYFISVFSALESFSARKPHHYSTANMVKCLLQTLTAPCSFS